MQPAASVPHVAIVFVLRQTVPTAAHPAGGAGQEQLADGKPPVQGLPLGQLVSVPTRQPFASSAHVMSLPEPLQTVPGPVQPAGGAGQQTAVPLGPEQLPAHDIVPVSFTHCVLGSSEQVTSAPARQTVPPAAGQSAGAAGQPHIAFG